MEGREGRRDDDDNFIERERVCVCGAKKKEGGAKNLHLVAYTTNSRSSVARVLVDVVGRRLAV